MKFKKANNQKKQKSKNSGDNRKNPKIIIKN